MDTRIASLMTAPVISVKADASVAEVADVLARNRLSFVPVTECAGGQALGIVSAADILHFKSGKSDLDTLRAWQICTYKPLSVAPDASTVDVARLMLAHQAHHVLVLRDNVLAGVVSSLDFVRDYIARAEAEAAHNPAAPGPQDA